MALASVRRHSTNSARGGRIRLEEPSAKREDSFLEAVRRSRSLHHPLVSPPATPSDYRAYLRRIQTESHAGYFLCLRGGDGLVGVVDISQIVRGAFRSGYLSDYAFAPHQGQGLMTEGLSLVLRDAFRRLGLHRLEANVQPGNEPSLRLVARLGFSREGFSPRYLKIGARWRDHERWAIQADR